MKVGQDIVLFMCIKLWIIKESDCQEEDYCPVYKQVVYICTNSELTMTTHAFIDTVNVPKFQQTFCQCIIAPPYHGHDEVGFRFYMFGTYLKGMQLNINDIVLESPYGDRTTYLTGETSLYFSTAENYNKENVCLVLLTKPQTNFNISCTKPKSIINTTLVTDTTTLVTSEDRAAVVSKDNITVSVTTADTTTDASKDNTTTRAQKWSSGNLIAIVVSAVIGALLILTVSVILLVYVKRRRLESRHRQQELHASPALSEPVTEQGQVQQNIASGEEWGPNISVNQYERLNMYVNDNLAGEMYQQLEAENNEEYQEMHDVKNISDNQDRHFTKETVFQEGKEQENNSNETSPNAYERLNMYVNDTLAGEMYQQLEADKTSNILGRSVPDSEHGTVVKSDRTTGTNENTSAVYTDAISQGDEYDDIA